MEVGLAGAKSVLLRWSLGDLRSVAGLAGGLPAARRGLLLARVALAASDHDAAAGYLDVPPRGGI
jgi:hypothetical protein